MSGLKLDSIGKSLVNGRDIKISGWGYAYYLDNGKTIYIHKALMNNPKNEVVDHINGNKLDNRKSNLRLASKQLNRVNSKVQKSKTGFRGVFYRPDRKTKWVARMNAGGVFHYIGSYNTKEEAALAWDKFASNLLNTKITVNGDLL